MVAQATTLTTAAEPTWSTARITDVSAAVRVCATTRNTVVSTSVTARRVGPNSSAAHSAAVTASMSAYHAAWGGRCRGSGGGSPEGRLRRPATAGALGGTGLPVTAPISGTRSCEGRCVEAPGAGRRGGGGAGPDRGLLARRLARAAHPRIAAGRGRVV